MQKRFHVKKGDEVEPLGEVSTVVRSLGEKRVRLYFSTAEEKSKAVEILKKCQAM